MQKKHVTKFKYPFTIKTLKKKLGQEGNYFNIIKNIYEKPTRNNNQRGELFLKDQEQGKDAHFCHFYSTVLKVVASAIKKEKEIKGIQAGNEKVNYVCKRYDLIYRKL